MPKTIKVTATRATKQQALKTDRKSANRRHGAAISDLTAATGWQVHSVHTALTGLRKDGKELIRAKDQAGATRYRLSAEG
jgi:Protein of unknown function (DUF3489)